MLYRLQLSKNEWPSQPRCSALIRQTLLRNLSRVRTWSHVLRRSCALFVCTRMHWLSFRIVRSSSRQNGNSRSLKSARCCRRSNQWLGGLTRTSLSRRLPSPPRSEEDTLAQSVHLFLAAIAQGLPAAGAMEAFGALGRGSFSHDDKCFYPESAALGPIADSIGLLSIARRLVGRGCEGEGDTTVFRLAGAVAAIVSDKALRAAWADGPRHWREGLEVLPDFIALPRDEAGRPIIPQSLVTALVEARDAWASELGTLDTVTRSITRGQLIMPRISAPSEQKALCNHPSWEINEDAKRALGPVIAKLLASGVLEYVAWDDRMPILLKP
jgi:hypothetical protein